MNTATQERPAAAAVPHGYAPLLATRSGFVTHCEGFHVHAERPVLAVRLAPHHLNSAGIAHGGFLATLADTAFGVILRRELDLQVPPLTASLSVDYIGAVKEGDWAEAHVEVHKTGRRLSNATCLVKVGERLMLRASGVFIMAEGGA